MSTRIRILLAVFGLALALGVGGYLGSGNAALADGGMLGSGTRSLADGGLMGSDSRLLADGGGVIGSGT